MEGDDPLFLACGYTGTAANGLQGGVAAVLIVADNAAHESDVLGGDAVVVVELDGGECGNVDAEFLFVRNLLCEDGVQRMVSFKNEDVVWPNLEFLAFEDTLSALEVVAWEFHFLSFEQLVHLLVEELGVHGLDALEIILALLVERSVHSVHKVVVRAEGIGFQSAGHQQDGKALAGCGLSAAAGTGNEHKARMAFGNLVHNVVEFLVLERFAHVYKLCGVSARHGHVEIAHVSDAQNVLPAVVFADDIHHLRLFGGVFQL